MHLMDIYISHVTLLFSHILPFMHIVGSHLSVHHFFDLELTQSGFVLSSIKLNTFVKLIVFILPC